MPRVPADHLRAGPQPFVYGHRGASARAPENTLRAFALALDEGADGVELDVHRCASGEVVVIHDPDLRRVAGVDVRVVDTAWSALRGHDVGAGERVPLLDEALDLVLARGGLVNVEVKADDPDHAALAGRVAQTLARRSPATRRHILLSTFHARLLGRLRALCPADTPIALLFDIPHTGEARAERLLASLDADGAHPQRFVARPELVQGWHAAGRYVNAWTINEPEDVQAMLKAGVDGLITDRVAEVRRALANAAA